MWPEGNGLFWFASKGYPVDKDETWEEGARGDQAPGCRNSPPSPCINSILRGRKERLARQEAGKQSLRVQNEKQGGKEELGRNREEDETRAGAGERWAVGARHLVRCSRWMELLLRAWIHGSSRLGLGVGGSRVGVGFFLDEGVLFCSVDVVPGVEMPG